MSLVWKKYPHLERMDSEEVDGLLAMPEIWIEPKIDGANATIFMEEGVVKAAKRSKPLEDADKGFRGLSEYVETHKDKFEAFFAEFPNRLIYGEWLVKHTIGYYRPSAYGHLYAYDILDKNTGHFVRPDTRMEMLSKHDITQIIPQAQLAGPAFTQAHLDKLQYLADSNKFLIDDKDKVGEGIVVKAFRGEVPFVNCYGRTTWAKIVRQEFKEKNVVEFGIPETFVKKQPEPVFIQEYVTPARVEKIKQKILDDKGTGWQSKYIGELLGRTWNDVFTEELWQFVKNHKVSNFNFKVAQTTCTHKVKEILGI